jgi:hypothetical protein
MKCFWVLNCVDRVQVQISAEGVEKLPVFSVACPQARS